MGCQLLYAPDIDRCATDEATHVHVTVVIHFEGKHGSLVVGEVEPTCIPQVMQ